MNIIKRITNAFYRMFYNGAVKGKRSPQLVKEYQETFFDWITGKKFVIDSTQDEWNSLKDTETDCDFPQAELSDILKGDLSVDCEVYLQFKDDDGNYRYGELHGHKVDEIKRELHRYPIPMEDIAEP